MGRETVGLCIRATWMYAFIRARQNSIPEIPKGVFKSQKYCKNKQIDGDDDCFKKISFEKYKKIN